MDKERVQWMLELGRRKREEGLDELETQELDALRQEYLKDFREGFRQQLDNVYIEQEDGTYQKLEKKQPDGPDTENKTT